jgi:hypothetical protein
MSIISGRILAACILVSAFGVMCAEHPGAQFSPSFSSLLPASSVVSARTFALARVTAFYAADKAKDTARLALMFTPDVTLDDKSLHSRLFAGTDLDGTPGGPTLFGSNSVGQSVSFYRIVSILPRAKGWSVTVNEQRENSDGTAAGPVIALFVLMPGGPGWLIDSYTRGQGGKYDAFLVQ